MIIIMMLHDTLLQVVEGKCSSASPARDPVTQACCCNGLVNLISEIFLMFDAWNTVRTSPPH